MEGKGILLWNKVQTPSSDAVRVPNSLSGVLSYLKIILGNNFPV